MALLFCDSFDHYSTAQAGKKWDTASFQSGSIGAVGRNGTNGWNMNSNGGGANSWFRKLLGTKTTLIAGVARKFDNPGTDAIAIAFDDVANGEQISVRLWQAARRLYVSRNGVTLAIGTTVLTLGVFYYIELKATIHGTTGAYELRLNGVTELTASGVNTRGSGTNNSADAVRLGANTNINLDVGVSDDFYVCDDSGAHNNDFLGDVRVQAILPSADGAHSDWAPNSGVTHYDRINQATADDDTTYLSDAAVNDIDSWVYDDLIPTTGTVKGIQFLPYVRKDDAGVRTIAPVVRISGTDYVQPDLPSLSTTYQFLPEIVELSPATVTLPFTIAEVNGMQGGLKVTA